LRVPFNDSQGFRHENHTSGGEFRHRDVHFALVSFPRGRLQPRRIAGRSESSPVLPDRCGDNRRAVALAPRPGSSSGVESPAAIRRWCGNATGRASCTRAGGRASVERRIGTTNQVIQQVCPRVHSQAGQPHPAACERSRLAATQQVLTIATHWPTFAHVAFTAEVAAVSSVRPAVTASRRRRLATIRQVLPHRHHVAPGSHGNGILWR
jgi:hypothetical protein